MRKSGRCASRSARRPSSTSLSSEECFHPLDFRNPPSTAAPSLRQKSLRSAQTFFPNSNASTREINLYSQPHKFAPFFRRTFPVQPARLKQNRNSAVRDNRVHLFSIQRNGFAFLPFDIRARHKRHATPQRLPLQRNTSSFSFSLR